MTDVFISYKREDRAHASRVVEALRADGFSVWWDDQITPDEPWDATIEGAISAAASVIVLWTPRSIASDWVRTEAHFGHDRKKLVPVAIERCEPPLAFRLSQTVDLCDWDGDRSSRAWRKLLTWVDDLRSASGRGVAHGEGQPAINPFRDSVGALPNGEPIVDGAFVNDATPQGTLFRDGPDAPVMRVVPAGHFIMGASGDDPDCSASEQPQRGVQFAQPFAISIYPVTAAQFSFFGEPLLPREATQTKGGWFGRRKTPTSAPVCRSVGDAPVNCISWRDAVRYGESLSQSTGLSYRLPSEAEWEYACRAQTRSRYSWGDNAHPSQACFSQISGGPQPAGRFAPNGFGLYDMHGNVREWTLDRWHDNYNSLPLDGSPALEGHSAMRVLRGGGWSDSAPMMRSSARGRATEAIISEVIGFRIVRELNRSR